MHRRKVLKLLMGGIAAYASKAALAAPEIDVYHSLD